jgi:glycosyltransferase involved in cell wall biosynthesis
MRIHFIVPEYTKTGGMRVVLLYAREFIKQGHIVNLFAPGIPFNNYKDIVKPYFIKYRIKKSMMYFLRTSKKNNFFTKTKAGIRTVPIIADMFIPDADIVIATSWTSSYAVNKLSERKGKKVYLVQDYEIWNSNEKMVDGSYSLPLFKITVSKYLKNLLGDKFNSKSEEILISPDYQVFYNDEKIFHSPLRILFMEHILSNKNVKGAIDIVIKLKEKYPDLIFNCFGVDNFNEMPKFVNFYKNPSDEEIRKLYCESQIFIFPSLYEGFGLPPAEAMACKCAVAGYAVAALPEYAENNKSAVLVEPGDADGLFLGIEKLINNSEFLKNVSFNGYDAVKKKLNWEDSANKFEETINRLHK